MKKHLLITARIVSIFFSLQFLISVAYHSLVSGYVGGIYNSLFAAFWIYIPAFWGLYALSVYKWKEKVSETIPKAYLISTLIFLSLHQLGWLYFKNQLDGMVSFSIYILILPLLFFLSYFLLLRFQKK